MAKKMSGQPWTAVKMKKAVGKLDKNGYIDFDFAVDPLETLAQLDAEVFAQRPDLFLRFKLPVENASVLPGQMKHFALNDAQNQAISAMEHGKKLCTYFDHSNTSKETTLDTLNFIGSINNLKGVEITNDFGYHPDFISLLPQFMDIVTGAPGLESFTVDCSNDSRIDTEEEKFILNRLYEAGKFDTISEKMLKQISKHWMYKDILKKMNG